MLPGEAGIDVRKTARYAGKDCDPLHPQAAQCLSRRLQERGISTRRVSLPEGHDPNSFFVGGGNAQEFQHLLERACL
jgi:hypothetical protein